MATMTGAYVLAFIWLSALSAGSDAYNLHRMLKRSAQYSPRNLHDYRYYPPQSAGYEPVTDYGNPRHADPGVFPPNSPMINVGSQVPTVPRGSNVVVNNEEPRPTNQAGANPSNPSRNFRNAVQPLDPTTGPVEPNPNPSNTVDGSIPGNAGPLDRSDAVPQVQPTFPAVRAPTGPQSALVVNRAGEANIPQAFPHSGTPQGNPGYGGQVFVPRDTHYHRVANPGYSGRGFRPSGRRGAVPAFLPHHNHHGSNPTIIQVPTFVPANPPSPIIINPPAQPTVREPNQELPVPIPVDPRLPAADDDGTPLTTLLNLLQQIFGNQIPPGVTGGGSSEESGGSSD